jgi:hypothetical protein
MLIKIGYDIALRFPISTAVIHLLHVHPSRRSDLVEPERFSTEPALPVEEYYDGFGNHRGRLCAPAGTVRFLSEAVIRDSGVPDAYAPNAAQLDICEIPAAALAFLLPSRYCEVDSELMDFARRTFLYTRTGWERVQAICDFVHGHLQFDRGWSVRSYPALFGIPFWVGYGVVVGWLVSLFSEDAIRLP